MLLRSVLLLLVGCSTDVVETLDCSAPGYEYTVTTFASGDEEITCCVDGACRTQTYDRRQNGSALDWCEVSGYTFVEMGDYHTVQQDSEVVTVFENGDWQPARCRRQIWK